MLPPRTPPPAPRRLALLLLGGGTLLAGGCAGAIGGALIEGALSGLRKTFLGAATENYGETYRDDFDKLLGALTTSAQDKLTAEEQAAAQAAESSAPVEAAPVVVAAPLALEFEVALFKEEIVDGRSVAVPVQDGDTLYDGYGDRGQGDNLKFRFRTNQSCWVYVISVDSTGWAQPLFPSKYSGQTNPVAANTPYEFPEGRAWMTLDSYRGIEHLYFLASQTQRLDLESALTNLAANVREEDRTRMLEAKRAEDVELVASAAPVTRGFGEARLSTVGGDEESPVDYPVEANVLSGRQQGDVLLTRWFRHR